MDGGAGVPIRKFEIGASADGFYEMLKDMGYGVHVHGYAYYVSKLGSPGRPKSMTRQQLMKMLDDARIEKGLEPIVKR